MSETDDDVLPRDIMGFSAEARAGGRSDRPLCLDLLAALADEMEAEGITGQPGELRRRYWLTIASGSCPLQATCERRRRAIERGGRPISRLPVQLRLL